MEPVKLANCLSAARLCLMIALAIIGGVHCETVRAEPMDVVPRQVAGGNIGVDLPEAGLVDEGNYSNPYFGLRWPLPAAWRQGLAGPPPSRNGFYVLVALDGPAESRTSMLVTAQDLFFAGKAFANAVDLLADVHAHITELPDLVIDAKPATRMIAGRPFGHFAYHAGGIYRIMLSTVLRCHLVMFNVSGPDQTAVDAAARELEAMSIPAMDDKEAALANVTPLCIKDYLAANATLRRVDPVPGDPKGVNIPVRIIIGTSGRVRHVHVISASDSQRRAIEDALMRWEFSPHLIEGQPVEIESGVLFNFKADKT